MKKRFQNNIYMKRWIVLLSIPILVSCKKFIGVRSPEDRIETANIFKNDQSAISAITGLYNRMLISNLYLANGGVTLYCGLSGDELYTTFSTNSLDVFYKNTLLPNTTALQGNLWVPAYKAIYQANAILEGIEKSNSLTDSVAKQLKGEALLIRALHYFYLVNLFGDVPLVLTTDYEVNSKMTRTDQQSIYRQLVSDLTEAENLLGSNYVTPGRSRANKYAALSLLSRVYLYLKDWNQAEAVAGEVINSSLYSLTNDVSNVFLNNSNETIWQLASDINNTAEGIAFIPFSSASRPNYAATAYLLNAFDTNDQRKIKWLKANVVSGQSFYYPYKYKSRVTTPITEYYIVLRLAEQYLIRAEARAEQNNLNGALSDLNKIRTRAGLQSISLSDQPSLLSAIAKERRLELFSEWGHRWFDLKRTGRADTVLSSIKAPNWQSTDVLFPIPLTQIQTNPFLIQNPGY